MIFLKWLIIRLETYIENIKIDWKQKKIHWKHILESLENDIFLLQLRFSLVQRSIEKCFLWQRLEFLQD